MFLPLLSQAYFSTPRLFPDLPMLPNVMDNTSLLFSHAASPKTMLVERPQQASGSIDSEVQLDLRNSENESDKFDSGGRYVDSFASGLDSVAVGVNRVTVKSNRGRVWALGNMPRRGGER
jgi:hypothetical protein